MNDTTQSVLTHTVLGVGYLGAGLLGARCILDGASTIKYKIKGNRDTDVFPSVVVGVIGILFVVVMINGFYAMIFALIR